MSNFIKLSVSKTATFQSCKAKYKFSYIQKLPRKEWEFHLFGRFCHRVLELFHQTYIDGSKNIHTKVMSDSFNAAQEEFKPRLTQAAKDEAFQICTQYLKRLATHKDEVSKVLSVEKTFNLEINKDLILTGMIDRIQLDEDGIYHVLDYKTSKSNKYLKDDLLQLLTYAYVIYNEHPEIKKVRVSYIMLRHDIEFITKEFELDDILKIKNIYESYANDIHKEEKYEPNPGPLCAYCDYIDSCPTGLATIKGKYKTGKTSW
jgi:CRISPR/Cas system-associated exonuclease Cas4 (RecB family)